MKVIIVCCISLALIKCESNDLANCYHGRVIMSSCCTGSTFINMDSSIPFGKKANLKGQEYPNVIQVPGFFNQTDLYIKLREFDPNKDSNLFAPIRCYCLIAEGMNMPLYVAVISSSCPQPKEN